MDTGPLVGPVDEDEWQPPTTCRACAQPFSSETITFRQEDKDLWVYAVDRQPDGSFHTRQGEGNYYFIALDTIRYWLECACGEEYDCDSWDGIHTFQEGWGL